MNTLINFISEHTVTFELVINKSSSDQIKVTMEIEAINQWVNNDVVLINVSHHQMHTAGNHFLRPTWEQIAFHYSCIRRLSQVVVLFWYNLSSALLLSTKTNLSQQPEQFSEDKIWLSIFLFKPGCKGVAWSSKLNNWSTVTRLVSLVKTPCFFS